jgi:two-component system, NarL family, sensor histidine kinase DegS
VSDALSGRLAAILAKINESITDTEAAIADCADDLKELLDSLEQSRTRIQGDLEQRQLEGLLRTPLERDDERSTRSVGTAELRESESAIIEQYSDASTIHRQVVEFGQLLAASREQLGSSRTVPGVDDANRLAVRQAMIRAQENERRRLSREVHDGPAQVLANAIIGLEFIERALKQQGPEDNEPSVAEIGRIKSAMREGLSEIRRFIFDLRPTMLTQRGLVATIEHYVQTYRSLLPTEIELSLPGSMPRLTADQELTAFRVIQEALQNIHRHAKSTKCWVMVEREDLAIVIKVSDNGRGFDPGAVNSSLIGGSGLVGMRERAEVIGARLAIDSRIGRGCQVTLRIPLKSHPNRDPVLDGIDRSENH